MRSDGNNPARRGIRDSLDSNVFLLEFDTLSEDFMRGFECGEIWVCLRDEVEYVHCIVAASNALMIMRMADATGYAFDACELTPEQIEILQLGPGEWMSVTLVRADEPK